jgi:acetyl-CoA carboxylase carboxyltransferase component
MVGPEVEESEIVRHVARMFVAGASLSVPLSAIAQGLRPRCPIHDRRRFPRLLLQGGMPIGEFGGMGLEGYVRLGFRKEMEAIADPVEREKYYKAKVAELYTNGKSSINGYDRKP